MRNAQLGAATIPVSTFPVSLRKSKCCLDLFLGQMITFIEILQGCAGIMQGNNLFDRNARTGNNWLSTKNSRIAANAIS